MGIPKIIKDIFWKNPLLSVEQKDRLYYCLLYTSDAADD